MGFLLQHHCLILHLNSINLIKILNLRNKILFFPIGDRDDNLDLVYKEPNKDLICYEYWKDIVHKKIAYIKYANSISSEFNAINIQI
jgi:hypothetical protein